MYIQNLNIKNLNTLAMQMPTLHTAKDVNLKVIQNNVDLTSHKGIWNVSTDKLANVVGKSYKIISNELGKEIKSVDNALQRIKKKLDKHLNII